MRESFRARSLLDRTISVTSDKTRYGAKSRGRRVGSSSGLPGKNIQLTKDIRYDGNLQIDLHRFLRVLRNLVKNALEAMPNGGILTLAIDKVDDQVVLRISGTGTGMPQEILSKLFEPFVTHGKSHGPGLGTAIAKSVVAAHKGTISASSLEGSGTTVEIRMPVPPND